MSRIKYTIVPKDLVENGIFESGVRLSESTIIIDPIVIFNNNMELGIEQEIYGNEVSPENIKFTTESNLFKLLKEVNDEEITNTIIINGFELTLDDMRDKIAPLAKESGKIYSVNVVSDRRKYNNFTINLTSEIGTEFSDDEWREYKQEYEESFIDSLKQDTEENKVGPKFTEDEAAEAVRELLKAVLGVSDDEIDKDEDEGMFTIDLDKNKTENLLQPIIIGQENSKKESDYKAYSYADSKGMITIESEDGRLIFMDEMGEIEVPIDYINFIIETLKKLK